jgi:hypothetical protein
MTHLHQWVLEYELQQKTVEYMLAHRGHLYSILSTSAAPQLAALVYLETKTYSAKL